MTFASVEYLIFFPTVFMLYWMLGRTKTIQNMLIVAASLVFYGWWDWRFLGLLLVTVLTTFYGGAFIQKADGNRKRQKWISAAVIVLNLGILFFFKYYNFFASCLGLPQIPGLSLPIGISFYTFQLISYLADVYRRGRNTAPHSVPRAASRGEYQAATGLEALFGWLYLQGRTERLNELFEVIMAEA